MDQISKWFKGFIGTLLKSHWKFVSYNSLFSFLSLSKYCLPKFSLSSIIRMRSSLNTPAHPDVLHPSAYTAHLVNIILVISTMNYFIIVGLISENESFFRSGTGCCMCACILNSTYQIYCVVKCALAKASNRSKK